MPTATLVDVTDSTDRKDGYLSFVAKADDTGKVVGRMAVPANKPDLVSAAMDDLRMQVQAQGYTLKSR